MTPISRAALLLAMFAFVVPAVAAEGEDSAENPESDPAASGDPSSEPSSEASGEPSSEPSSEPSGEAAGDTSSDGSGDASSGDTVQDVEDCVCNGSDNGTEPAPDPLQDRASCNPAEIDPIPNNDVYDIVEVDPDGCYRAAVKKAAEGQPVLIRNIICMIVERIP